MKITIIGAGSMGGATALGLSKGRAFSAPDITVTATHEATLEKFKAKGMNVSLNNAEAVEGADIIAIVVKPWLVEEVIKQIKPRLDFSRQTILCFAAGVKPEVFMNMLTDEDGHLPNVLFVIPNTAIEVGQSVTFISPVHSDENHTAMVKKIFDEAGKTSIVDQAHLGAGMALASCGLAYAFRYIRAAAEGGVELGIRPDEAARIVAQTVKGAAGLMEAHGSHPEAEIDKVTTPGGLTIKGLNAMEEAGFTNAVIKGLKASLK